MTKIEILEKVIQKAIEDATPIDGFVGRYWVTPEGRVFSRTKELKQYLDRKGYYRVTLNKKVDGVWKSQLCQVHRLIAKAFIPNPHNKPQVNHRNGVRSDNRMENLEWATAQENVQDGYNRGRVTWNKHMKSVNNMNLEDLARQLPRLQEECKALWGKKFVISRTEGGQTVEAQMAYLWHLQQMVIAEDPIKYLGEHI